MFLIVFTVLNRRVVPKAPVLVSRWSNRLSSFTADRPQFRANSITAQPWCLDSRLRLQATTCERIDTTITLSTDELHISVRVDSAYSSKTHEFYDGSFR
jgi:hypothetical protein